MIKNLVCFTASFPYHNREAFFEAELKYLAKEFEHLYIIPMYNPGINQIARNTPPNVTYLPPASPQGFRRIIKGLFNSSPVKQYFKDFINNRVYTNKRHLKNWINSFLVFRALFAETKKAIANLNEDDTLLYSYWAEAPLFTTNYFKKYRKAIRMHGGDFYLNRNDNYLPLRQEIYNNCDVLLPISEDIKSILIQHYRIDPQKIQLSYLGVSNPSYKINPTPTTNNRTLVLVSCSNAVALKQIDKIIAALHFFPENTDVVWHHFGDGPLLENLKQQARALPKHIQCEFHGWVKPQELLNFYEHTSIDWLINASKFEGVPVSIMEAMSYGIPVIATDVGATREIVNQQNGYLIPGTFEPEQLSRLILQTNSTDYANKRKNARKTWQEKFNADKNYLNLIKILKQVN